MNDSMCPICGEIMRGADSLVQSEEGWVHRQCGRSAPLPDEPPFVPPSPIGERIVEVVTRMLEKVVERGVAEERARNAVAWLITEFNVTPRTEEEKI